MVIRRGRQCSTIALRVATAWLLVASLACAVAMAPTAGDSERDSSGAGSSGGALEDDAMSTDRTLVMSDGEGTVDVLDESFVYNHEASMASCEAGDGHGQDGGGGELVTGCWPLGRLLLHPEEHANAAALLAAGETEQLEYALADLIMTLDSGKDADGEATGGAGDGTIEPNELANRVYAVLRNWQYEADRLWTERVDADADGLITFAEAAADVPPDDEAALAAWLARFNFADSKKDGWLGETDIGPFRNPLWFGRMHQWALGAFLQELGTNVSRAEYTVADRPDMRFSWSVRVPVYVKEREFERLDRDGDGTLGLREAVSIPETRLASIVTHGVAALMHVCDADGDRALSADEIVAQAAAFAAAPGLPSRAWSDEADGESDADADVDADAGLHEEL